MKGSKGKPKTVAAPPNPVLAALFVTAWEMFGVAFSRELAEPATRPLLADTTSPVEPTSEREA